MSFMVTSPVVPSAEPEIRSGDFWPAVDPVLVRDAQRIDSGITPARLRSALIEAIASVNAELSDWRLARLADGHATLAAVPAETVEDKSINLYRYVRAVGCLAKASLTERYRDVDTTAHGDRKADVMENPIDDLYRDVRWAIADIQGKRRTVVELI
jgi:hypothetical protein